MSVEKWCDIQDYPDYQISSHGRVRNTFTKAYLMGGLHQNNKRRVTLQYLGEKQHVYIHRLVAKHFLPGWREGIGVVPIDGDWSNCNLNNLRYEGNVTTKRLDLKVKVVETGQIFDTVAETARQIHGQASNVKRVLEGTLPRHKGYTFKYVTR